MLTVDGDVECPESGHSRVDVAETRVRDAGELEGLVTLRVDETVTTGANTLTAQRGRDQVVGTVVLPAAVARVNCRQN